MKKLIFILMMVLTSNFYGQNAEWTGTKTFKSNLKFLGLPVNNGNTKFITLDANGKPCTSVVPTPEPQVQTDWNATSGIGTILNKPIIPDISGLATNAHVDSQDETKVDKVPGERLINAGEITKLANQSGINSGDIILTTDGTSGPATLVGSNLNIPIYPVGGGIDPTALHLTTNETFTGIKSTINTTDTATNALELTNSANGMSSFNSHVLRIVNSGRNGKGLSIINSSVAGEGFRLIHTGAGAGMVIGCKSTSPTDVPLLVSISNDSPKGNCLSINNQATNANDGVQTQGLGLVITGSTGSGTSLRINHLSTQVNSPAVAIYSSVGNLALKTNGDIECGKYKVPTLNNAPSSATDTGTAGEIRFTAVGIFICTETNSWIKCVGAPF